VVKGKRKDPAAGGVALDSRSESSEKKSREVGTSTLSFFGGFSPSKRVPDPNGNKKTGDEQLGGRTLKPATIKVGKTCWWSPAEEEPRKKKRKKCTTTKEPCR